MNIGACRQLSFAAEKGDWYRALDVRYLRAPLSTAHTLAIPSRFSAGSLAHQPYEILYLTENHLVALLETETLYASNKDPGSVVPNPSQEAISIIKVAVQVQRVADLTQPAALKKIRTSYQELTGDWFGYLLRNRKGSLRRPAGIAPTQDLGETLFSLPGVEGFRTVSAKLPYHMNLVVFPSKLLKGSRIVYQDSAAAKLHTLKG